MDEYARLSHAKWDCKYRIVLIQKCSGKVLCKTLRRHLGEVFRDLAQQRKSKIEEGHWMPGHVHAPDLDIADRRSVAGSWLPRGPDRDPLGAGVSGVDGRRG